MDNWIVPSWQWIRVDVSKDSSWCIVILAKVNGGNVSILVSLGHSARCLKLTSTVVGNVVGNGVDALIVLDVLGASDLFDGVHVGTRLGESDVVEYSIATKKSAGTSGVAGGSLRHWAGWVEACHLKDKDVRSIALVFRAVRQEVVDQALGKAAACSVVGACRACSACGACCANVT